MRGLTLIEILLVVGILVILVTLTSPLALDFYRSQQLDTHTQGIIQTLRRAQLKAMSIENDSNFGVYLTNDDYTLFKGNSYDPNDPYNEVSDLPRIITVTTAPDFSEVVFSKFEGIPKFDELLNTTGTVILSNNIDSRTISINEIGRINLK